MRSARSPGRHVTSIAIVCFVISGSCASCDTALGERSDGGPRDTTDAAAIDGSAIDGGAIDGGSTLLDGSSSDARVSDGAEPPAPDASAAPDAAVALDAGPVPPFGPCGCEICPCPAPPPNCDFPQGVPEEAFTGADALPTLHDEVNAVMVAITGCGVGSSCPHGHGPDHAGAQPFFDDVIAGLRARGLCAGQHRTGETDEIAVSRNCRAVWEGYHIAAYGSGTVVWARYPSAPCGGSACPGLGGGSFRGIWWVPGAYCP